MSENIHTATAAPAEDPKSAAYEAAYHQATKSERRARVGRRAAMAGGGLALLAAGAGLLGSGHAQGEAKVADLAGAGVAVAAAAGSRKIAERLDASEQRHGGNAAVLGIHQLNNSTKTGSEAPAWAAHEVHDLATGTGQHSLPESHAVAVGPGSVNIEGWQKTIYETSAGNVQVMQAPSAEQLPPASDAQQMAPVAPHNPGA